MNRSFWLRFGLLLAVALVPLGVFAALSGINGPDLKAVAQRAANEYDRLLQLRRQQVFTMAALPSIRAFTASDAETRSQRAAVALSELQAWVASDTNVREAFITDGQGTVIIATREGWNDDVSARQFVQDALHGQLAVSPVARDRSEFSNYYAAPVLNNSKEVAGALVIRVAAQELWSATPHGEGMGVALVDENGVRLDDSVDPALRLASLAPLSDERATAIVRTQLYGTQLPQPRATELTRAQELVQKGALDQLTAADMSTGMLAAQRLVSKPWVVLAMSAQSPLAQMLAPLGIALAAAFLLALGGAFLLKRV